MNHDESYKWILFHVLATLLECAFLQSTKNAVIWWYLTHSLLVTRCSLWTFNVCDQMKPVLVWYDFVGFFNRVRMESFVLGAMIHHHSMTLTGWLQTTGFVTFAPDPWDSRRGGLGPLGYLATFKTYMDHQVNLRFFCTETTETHPILKGNIEVLLVSSA